LDTTFGQFTGAKLWTDVDYDVVVPLQTRLLQVQVIRQRSLRFDNKLGGTAWIDDLGLQEISTHAP